MLTKDFYFDLPPHLIAQYPSKVRGKDRLMVLDRFSGAISHKQMDDLPDLVEAGTLMVFNNSKVRHSRCYAYKLESSDKVIEFLIIEECVIDDIDSDASTDRAEAEKKIQYWRAMVRPAKKQRPGNSYRFFDGTIGTIVENPADRGTEFRTLKFFRPQTSMGKDMTNKNINILDEQWFEANGHIPLPPYIRRSDTKEDAERYQNIYATEIGSSACPTAGLHFTSGLMERLAARGAEIVWLTLHVGLGTFLPVRTKHIEEHIMHKEVFTISPQTANAINKAKQEKRKILAVGTTSVRSLESAWENGKIQSGTRSTQIFLYPGSAFYAVDSLFTNFHTPESTLMMLVSAFAGTESLAAAYQEAVKESYRFFSYGDAMFITQLQA